MPGHQFEPTYLNRPTWCTHCGDFIVGITKSQQNAFKCRKCKAKVHQACLAVFSSDTDCIPNHYGSVLNKKGNYNTMPEKRDPKPLSTQKQSAVTKTMPGKTINQPTAPIYSSSEESEVYEPPLNLNKMNLNIKKKKILYDFEGEPNTDEISVKTGDEVSIVGTDDGGWIQVSLNGKQGFVPTAYVDMN